MLDEGFGTLDVATLDTVAATLENLAARGDRMVGVVTHVPALAERVPVRFEVRKDARTARVERTGLCERSEGTGRLFVDAWDPAYGAVVRGGGRRRVRRSPEQRPGRRRRRAAGRPTWRGRSGRRRDVRAPRTWCCWSTGYAGSTPGCGRREDDGGSYPGMAASYAAGVVRCDLRRGAAELAGARVDRGLFTASPSAQDLVAGTVRYRGAPGGRHG